MKDFSENKNTLQVEITEDGSPTLFVKEMNEHYHSVKGALTEAEHIYRDCAFRYRAAHPLYENGLRVLEIGFGTGLNALVTALACQTASVSVHYIALEKYPVKPELLDSLDYGRQSDPSLFRQLHEASWNMPVVVSSCFLLEKRCADLLYSSLPTDMDVVYFDAFAPEKQPEMWSDEIFRRIYAAMRQGGVLTTYCAKGAVRRLLQSVGFRVERISGPPGGKREILRAVK